MFISLFRAVPALALGPAEDRLILDRSMASSMGMSAPRTWRPRLRTLREGENAGQPALNNVGYSIRWIDGARSRILWFLRNSLIVERNFRDIHTPTLRDHFGLRLLLTQWETLRSRLVLGTGNTKAARARPLNAAIERSSQARCPRRPPWDSLNQHTTLGYGFTP
jgi:hypothetical protein